ncbi:acetolactate decarboxylase [Gimesia algae]|uniref:Uncharacterized protein n=1 Tax=Gimesia algae TaxID=2527971 RepID=A0A517VKX2_9PLAN|nr:hypothetical protein [Gimesia algae]QDT93590.1 hypothetical protein Pan161_52710 [Gimesia algae]
MNRLTFLCCFGLFALAISDLKETTAEGAKKTDFVQYGKMHEVIGKQQHQGRVKFTNVIKKPHFYGVAALESLADEATIFDHNVTLTRLKPDGTLASGKLTPNTQAALLVGAYVDSWTKHPITDTVKSDDLDMLIEKTAKQAGINTNEPFMFVIQGDFKNARFHVIYGACPIRARMRKEVLPKEKQPYEADIPKVTGKLIGVFAKDSVGNITHPATSTHMHLLYKDKRSGEMRTGHVERLQYNQGQPCC